MACVCHGLLPCDRAHQLDKAGCLIPSTRLIDKVKMTESAIVQDLFQCVAAGGTTSVAEASRFNALGLPTTRYHSNGTVRKAGQRWYPARIVQMITCPTYKGTHIYKSRFGAIEREVPPLVDAPLWEVANAQLQRNRKLPKGNTSRVYLLRGLITCGRCGATYTGQSITYRSGNPGAFYRCGGRRPHHFANGIRCDSKAVQAAWLEGIVWDDCRGFIRNPGQALAEAQRQLQDRQHDVAAVELERSMYHKALMEKAKARDDILLLVRRGAIALNDAQSHLTDIAREEDTIRGQLAAIDAQRALVDAHAAHIQDAQRMLERLHTQLQEIETAEAQDIRCQVVEMLVREIRIDTHPDRSLTAEITYAFRPAHVAHNATARRSETLSCPAGPLHPYV
jgi:site-specific DNA recombinase